MTKAKKAVLAVLIVVLSLWLIVMAVDFSRVYSFEKPLFCIAAETFDDGGSGKYVGLGYSFDLEGNFMPEAEHPGIIGFDAYLFGIRVLSAIQ